MEIDAMARSIIGNPTAIAAALREARTHQRAGRLTEAESAYRRIVAAEPGHAEAWHQRGLVAHQLGTLDTAYPALLSFATGV